MRADTVAHVAPRTRGKAHGAMSRPSSSRPAHVGVNWFNTRRLLEPIGYVPPVEYEARYYEQLRGPATIADGVAAGILRPPPTDDCRSWGIL